MKTFGALLTLVLCLVAADAAVAKDEVMLRDGTTAMVDIVETTPTTVKVAFQSKSGASGETTLNVANMDLVNFYNVRRKHMEKTAENHVKLAIVCFKYGDFNRAKRQWDLALNLEPDLVEKLTEKPDIVEKIAAAIYEGVIEFEKQGALEKAHDVASRLVAKIPDAPSSEKARQWLAKNQAEYEKNREAEEQEKAAAIETAEKEDDKKRLAANEKVLKPIRKLIDEGAKYNAAGLQEKSSSKSKSAYEAAASKFKGAFEKARKEQQKKDLDPNLVAELGQLDKTATSECVDALLNAANVELGKGNVSGAKKYAEQALKVDPGNAAATDMLTKTEMAATDKFYLDEIRGRRPRGGGGRAGGRAGGGRR